MGTHWTTKIQRRWKLKQYAQRELRKGNDGQALVNIVARAVEGIEIPDQDRSGIRDRLARNFVQFSTPYSVTLVEGDGDALAQWGYDEVIEDLQLVLVGTGLGERHRHEGIFYVGWDFIQSGETVGFKPGLHIDDETGISEAGQVQHAVAGLVIGYRLGPLVETFAQWDEDKPHDNRLYDVTFAEGNWLRASERRADGPDSARQALEELPERILNAVCDDSCTLPDGSEVGLDLLPEAGSFNMEEHLSPSEFTFTPDAPATDAFSMEADAAGRALSTAAEQGFRAVIDWASNAVHAFEPSDEASPSHDGASEVNEDMLPDGGVGSGTHSDADAGAAANNGPTSSSNDDLAAANANASADGEPAVGARSDADALDDGAAAAFNMATTHDFHFADDVAATVVDPVVNAAADPFDVAKGQRADAHASSDTSLDENVLPDADFDVDGAGLSNADGHASSDTSLDENVLPDADFDVDGAGLPGVGMGLGYEASRDSTQADAGEPGAADAEAQGDGANEAAASDGQQQAADGGGG